MRDCAFCERPFSREREISKCCSGTCRFYVKTWYSSVTGCLEWTASTNADGYGQFRFDGKVRRAHRVRWIMERGPIPEDVEVCHMCNNPACVLFSHLYLDTSLRNAAYMVKCGRAAHGVKNAKAHVFDEEKNKIVELYETGTFTQQELADRVGVHRATISHWVRGTRRPGQPPFADMQQHVSDR